MIYLDNASTTKMSDAAYTSMVNYMRENYGNPSSVHSAGVDAKGAVIDSRKKVAKYLGCIDDDNIIFTSGGTEGNNMILKGFVNNGHRKNIAVSAVEHDSVFESVDPLYKVVIPVTTNGYVDPSTVEHLLKTSGISLVSVMYCNNETGIINPIKEIADVCHRNGAFLHSDFVQAGGYDLDVDTLGVDFATISSHKIHGPKGVGAVYVRDKSLLKPIITGGRFHEFGLRSGTENVPGIVGFGSACIDTLKNENVFYTGSLKLSFYSRLLSELNGIVKCRMNGQNDGVGKIASITIDKIDAQTLVMMADMEDVCISAGSACNNNDTKPSRVLKAMGMSDFEARNTIRVSFSMMNTIEEVENAANIIASCITQLKKYKKCLPDAINI